MKAGYMAVVVCVLTIFAHQAFNNTDLFKKVVGIETFDEWLDRFGAETDARNAELAAKLEKKLKLLRGTEEEATQFAIDFLERVLKSPGTMKLVDLTTTEINSIAKAERPYGRRCDWEVKGALDSQNGFGALLRTDFVIGVYYRPPMAFLLKQQDDPTYNAPGVYEIKYQELKTR